MGTCTSEDVRSTKKSKDIDSTNGSSNLIGTNGVRRKLTLTHGNNDEDR